MPALHEPFAEFAPMLLACALAGALFVRLRQPVLVACIVVGISLGPALFGLVGAHDQIDLLAQVGVTVLLFVVGLKLDLHHIRHIGPAAPATGLGQLAFTIVIGFGLILALGKGWLEALCVAVALTFSSTIIIVKLLSDKGELDSLHGRTVVEAEQQHDADLMALGKHGHSAAEELLLGSVTKHVLAEGSTDVLVSAAQQPAAA